MKKRPSPPADPAVVQHELLQKKEELRHMKQKMNELAEENKKAKASQARLEKLVKRDVDDPSSSAAAAGGAVPGSTLAPRDAQAVANLLEDQRKRMEEKDRMIKSLLAGARMQDMGAKRAGAVGGSNPAAIYGHASSSIKRPAKKGLQSSPTSRPGTARKPPQPQHHHDVEHEQPDFQPALSGSLSRQGSRAAIPQTPLRSPEPSSSPESKQQEGGDDHYMQFNARLQSRLNSSQNFHRSALGVDGASSSGTAAGDAAASAAASSGAIAPGHLDDLDSGGGGSGDMNELVWIRRELRQKKAKIASLQSHFDHLTVSFRVEKDLQKMTLAQCEELKATVATLQSRERQYQRQLEGLEDARLQLQHQQAIMHDLQADKKALEERVASLHSNLFQGDTMEALRHKQLLSEHAATVQKLQNDLEAKDAAMKSLKAAQATLLEKASFGDNLARDKTALAKENMALRERCAELTEKLVVFSVDSGVEVDELERALDIVRRQKDDPTHVRFLHGEGGKKASDASGDASGSDPALDTVPSLRRRVAQMELQMRDLVVEIQQKSDMLNVQYALGREASRAKAEQNKRIAQLQQEVDRLKFELANRPTMLGREIGAGMGNSDNMSESIFNAGSEAGSDALGAEQLTGLENLIALRVLSATLKRDSPHFDALTGGSLPLTFLGADFFDFESSFSEVFSGWNPRYAFTTQYAVDADEFLLAHLEKEALVVTLYQQLGGTDYRKIAQAFIPLRGLLSPTAGIEGRAQLIHLDNPAGITSSGGVRGALRDGGDEDSDQARAMALTSGRGGAPSGDAVVGELHYVLRMKRPIVSTPASPAGSRGGTPVRGMSRAGSIIGAGAGGVVSSAAGGWSTGAGQQQSRATLQHQQSSAAGLYARQPSALGPPQQHQPQQQQTAFGAARPASAYSAGQLQQSSGQSLSMDDFDSRHPQPQPPQAAARNLSLRPSASNRALTAASSAASGSSHTRDVAHALDTAAQQPQSHPQPAARTATVMELPLTSSEWDEDHGGYTNSGVAGHAPSVSSSSSAQRAPSSLGPQASRVGYGGPQQQHPQALPRPASMYTGSASTGPSSRRSSNGQTAAAQAAAQRERDIQDLLNNPEAQAGLFGNSSGQSTAREDAF